MKNNLTKERLFNLYWKDKKSLKQIAIETHESITFTISKAKLSTDSIECSYIKTAS